MRKRLFFVFFTSMISFGVSEALAESGDDGNIHWDLTDSVLTITKKEGSQSGVMPDYAYNAAPWYTSRDSIRSIVVDNSVTSIGNNAFRDTSKLENISISEGITSIGQWAFSGSSLPSINLPSTLNNIASSAFMNAKQLDNVTIPSGVTKIEMQTFYNNSSLTNITIPEGVTLIGSSAFYGAKNLQSVTLPSTLQYIQNAAFQGATSLTSIEIPEGVISIGSTAFQSAKNLQSITLPSTLKSIENYAFNGTNSLTTLTIPEGITSIGNYAFAYMYGLEKLYCPKPPSNSVSICSGKGYTGTIIDYEKEGDLYKIGNTYYASVSDMQSNTSCGSQTECEAAIRGETMQQNSDGSTTIYNADGTIKGFKNKRIYTVQEAEKLSKPTGNTFKLRYK